MRSWCLGLGALLSACSQAHGMPSGPASMPAVADASALNGTALNVAATSAPSDAPLGAPEARALDVGDSFVDFGLPELQLDTGTLGRIVWLSEFVGSAPQATAKRVLLLNFFATWCAPCVAEFAVLSRWQQAYGAQGLQVVSVNFRLPEEDLQQALLDTRRLLQGREILFPLLFERYTRRNQRVYLGARVVLPTNLLIGADGKILARARGAQPNELEALEQRLRSMLGVEAGSSTPVSAVPNAQILDTYRTTVTADW